MADRQQILDQFAQNFGLVPDFLSESVVSMALVGTHHLVDLAAKHRPLAS